MRRVRRRGAGVPRQDWLARACLAETPGALNARLKAGKLQGDSCHEIRGSSFKSHKL